MVILTGVRWNHCSFDLHLLIISSDEHVFMCLLAISMSSLEKYLFRPCDHFLVGYLLFCYWIVEAVYIFWKLSLCWLHHLQISSLSWKFVFFILFMDSFAVRKLVCLVDLICFTSVAMRHWLMKTLIQFMSECFANVLFLEFYGVLS